MVIRSLVRKSKVENALLELSGGVDFIVNYSFFSEREVINLDFIIYGVAVEFGKMVF